ncbi:MAG TPA: hypothetical protein VEQ84_17100 [Vicinamibacteria bacterium]|nr:hypothetical protein [Vicinamibacteria bacterium]
MASDISSAICIAIAIYLLFRIHKHLEYITTLLADSSPLYPAVSPRAIYRASLERWLADERETEVTNGWKEQSEGGPLAADYFDKLSAVIEAQEEAKARRTILNSVIEANISVRNGEGIASVLQRHSDLIDGLSPIRDARQRLDEVKARRSAEPTKE